MKYLHIQPSELKEFTVDDLIENYVKMKYLLELESKAGTKK